ncbi:MAG: cellulosomal protein [Deltaproteobacteria bacterium]|nr:cellulosomal protein [Deltaproteobacteria bacterium]
MWITRVCGVCFVSLAMMACHSSTKNDDEQGDAGSGDTGQNDAGSVKESDEAMFDPTRVVEVEIEIDPVDWDVLRYEGRELATLFSGCAEDLEYTYFDVTATIDGNKVEHVGVRKKGYLGSLSVLRPSLKINFGKFAPGQTYSGMKRMTLNNDRQDPSHTHQVMSYALFREAGVVSPRANFAHVTVNGEDLGFYTHVESIKKPFLARHFDDNDGNRYEGQGADFMPEAVHEFQRKTNETGDGGAAPDRSDLDRVVDALQVEDSELVEALGKVVDLDAFITFWAVEVITGHWDGYAGNKNNFYTYHDPTTDLFYFIPWGTDGAFAEDHSFLPDLPKSVYAWGQLAYRLYSFPETRALYHEKLESLLKNNWNENTLLAEVDRIEALVSSHEGALEYQRTFLTGRKDSILAELVDEGPEWIWPPYDSTYECNDPVEISGSFDTIWSTGEMNYTWGNGVSLTLTLFGEEQEFESIVNSAGSEDEEDTSYMSIGFYAERADSNPLYISLIMPTELAKIGEVSFHGVETMGILFELVGPEDPRMVGYIGNGSITFETVSTSDGDQIKGSFSGLMSQ